MKIIFLGSSDFGIFALERLVEEKFFISAIVTTGPKPQGRGLKSIESPIARYAGDHGMNPVFCPHNLKDNTFIDQLAACHADLFVVIAYRILPSEVFSLPRFGTINVHASLLPGFRGPAPIQRAIEAGEKETGVTVFRIDKGIDTGNIILQKSLSIKEQETTPQLYERLARLGADALIEACLLFKNEKVTYFEQNHALASRAPKLEKREAVIDWTLPALVIFNKIRAFKPFPGTATRVGEKQLIIEWALPLSESGNAPCGTVTDVTKDWFDVQCHNSMLRMLEIKLEGKKQMKVRDFLLGMKIEKGMKLG